MSSSPPAPAAAAFADHLDLNAAASAEPIAAVEEQKPKRGRGRPKKSSFPPPPPLESITYLSPFQDETKGGGGFVAGDLVWGKVRSHPWWPGQVFDAAAASEMAARARKKEGLFLVAYFGDKTFAWNEAAAMRPYATHFPKMARQSGAEDFAAAVDASLAEVTRRVLAAMACRCVNTESIPNAFVENAGIQEGTRAQSSDCSFVVNSFVPERFLDFVQDLAVNPGGITDRLEIVVVRAQLKAFDRSRGFPDPPEFLVDVGFENGEGVVLPALAVTGNKGAGSNSTPLKRRKKRKRITEGDSDSDWEPGRKKYTDSESDSDLDWRSSNRRSVSRGRAKKGSGRRTPRVEKDVPVEYLSAHEMLSQLELVAMDPIKGYSFLPMTVSFFAKYKDSLVPSSLNDKELLEMLGRKKGRRKYASSRLASFAVEDSYWSDIVVNDIDNEPVSSDSSGRKRKQGSQPKRGNKMQIKEPRRLDESSAPPVPFLDMETDALPNNLEEKLEETPTALVLNFSSGDAIPSESDLNNIFRIYGSIREGETEIMRNLSSAKVVFDKRADAEVAFSSAGKYSIFGPALLSYELSYLPSPLKVSQMPQNKTDALPFGGAISDAPGE